MDKNKSPDALSGRTPGFNTTSNPDRNENSAKAQRERLLRALKHRTLTTLQARRLIDVLHVGARIMELRRAGHNIITEWTTDYTSEGMPHRVARYALVEVVA